MEIYKTSELMISVRVSHDIIFRSSSSPAWLNVPMSTTSLSLLCQSQSSEDREIVLPFLGFNLWLLQFHHVSETGAAVNILEKFLHRAFISLCFAFDLRCYNISRQKYLTPEIKVSERNENVGIAKSIAIICTFPSAVFLTQPVTPWEFACFRVKSLGIHEWPFLTQVRDCFYARVDIAEFHTGSRRLDGSVRNVFYQLCFYLKIAKYNEGVLPCTVPWTLKATFRRGYQCVQNT